MALFLTVAELNQNAGAALHGSLPFTSFSLPLAFPSKNQTKGPQSELPKKAAFVTFTSSLKSSRKLLLQHQSSPKQQVMLYLIGATAATNRLEESNFFLLSLGTAMQDLHNK